MCGIIGYLDKRGSDSAPVGNVLFAMLQALSCRGPDSAGIALFGPPGDWKARVAAPAGVDPDSAIDALRQAGLGPLRDYDNGVYDALLPPKTPVGTVIEDEIAEALPGAEVICLGRQISLYKQVGSPDLLEATYLVSGHTGSHGIGHTRLSTESKVDLSHSQPFWAHGVPDLATVHNGHITNYHKLRRIYEQRGYRFFTENDSEVIGVYLRDRMAAGLSFEDALRSSLDDFDGAYCYIAANGDTLAFVKDRFGFKPFIVAETDAFVAIATEEIALRSALGRDFKAAEPAPEAVRIWKVERRVANAPLSGS